MFRQLSDIDTLVIHCADTPNGKPWTADDIDFWHQVRGFGRSAQACEAFQPNLPHIGYHKVIEIDGRVVRGRSFDEVGAHAEGLNQTSLGYCLIGRDQFSRIQWHVLRSEVEELLRAMPGLKVIGHRDHDPDRICPGFDVGTWLSRGMEPLAKHLLTTKE